MAQEEKLEEAKRLYKTANQDQRYVLEKLFPELKESEDEQVRKEIIEFLQDCNAIDSGYFKKYCKTKIEKMIAWLEKQGEFYTKRDVDNAYIEGMAFAKDELEKQGEQKHADSHCSDCTNAKGCVNCTDGDMKETGKPCWSEEDEERLKSCLNILQAKGIMGVTDTINSNWLKSLKERVQPQPKQEWSEEDKKHIGDIMDYLNDYYCMAKDEDKNVADGVLNEIRWLQSI